MIYGTVYGNELTPLAPWLMGQRHYFYFHGIWNQSARLADYLERYEVGLLEYEEILRSIHRYLTQGVMNQGTLIPPNFTTKHGKEG